MLFAHAAPPATPLPAPDYSFDLSSPAVADGFVGAADVLVPGLPYPVATLRGLAFDLVAPLDEIDALSGGNPGMPSDELVALLFSVTRTSTGLAAPAPELIAAGVPYNVLDQSGRGQAAGDEFCSTELFTRMGNANDPDGGVPANNFLARNNFDEGGTDQSARPETSAQTLVPPDVPQDGVDALAQLLRLDGGGPIARAYFSLTAGSPSLAALSGLSGPSGANVFCAIHPGALLGACCQADGSCAVLGPDECINSGGVWLGWGSTCELCQPPAPADGACCLPGQSCSVLGFEACEVDGGSWLGPGTTCSMCPMHMTSGACCLPDGSCQILTCYNCMAVGGQFLGGGTQCDQCQPPGPDGACCFGDGSCAVVNASACIAAGGTPLDGGTTCAACMAPSALGACCAADGSCQQSAGLDCHQAGGVFHFHQVCQGDGDGDLVDDVCQGSPSRYVVSMYAAHDELGLCGEDELDALLAIDTDDDGQFDAGDQVLFSLAAGSPSLTTIPGASAVAAAADVFSVTPGQAPTLFAAAADLGLGGPLDDLDGLDLYCVGVPRGTLALEHGIRAPRGDLNCDGAVNFDDINHFVLILADLSAWQAVYPTCPWQNGDINGDGSVDFADISPFVALLSGS